MGPTNARDTNHVLLAASEGVGCVKRTEESCPEVQVESSDLGTKIVGTPGIFSRAKRRRVRNSRLAREQGCEASEIPRAAEPAILTTFGAQDRDHMIYLLEDFLGCQF